MKPEDYRDDHAAPRRHRPRNYVRPPSLNTTPDQQEEAARLMEGLHRIEPLRVVAVFDAAPPADRVELVNPSAPAVLALLSHANLRRGSVIVFERGGEPVPPAVLARLNWFLHVHGYSRGFRGWRIAQEREEGALARSRFAWASLKQVIGL